MKIGYQEKVSFGSPELDIGTIRRYKKWQY